MTKIFFWGILAGATWSMFSSCKPKSSIEQVLSEVRDKRPDLEYVLSYYTKPQDSLKHQSAVFLIEHLLPDQYRFIDRELFVKNIDLAFEVWKRPWAQGINFEQFKELILPFDLVRDDKGVFWRERFLKEYSYVLDSLPKYPNEPPAKVACMLINKAFRAKYIAEFDRDKRTVLSLNDWERIRNGDCTDMAYLTNHVMHAIGVPTAVEFTPQWGNLNYRHYWNVAWYNGRFWPFTGTEGYPGHYKVDVHNKEAFIKKRTTVFRKMYRINPQSLAAIKSGLLPGSFTNPGIVDITHEYLSARSVTVAVPEGVDDDILYACVVHLKKWLPVAWAPIKQGKVQFAHLNPTVVYAVARQEKDSLILISSPFLLERNGKLRPLAPQLNDTHPVKCLRKFPYDNTNLIKVGDRYRLDYWSPTKGWTPLSEQVATSSTITFRNTPREALLILRNLSRGTQERSFYYQDGKQVF